MKKSVIALLECPISRSNEFRVFARRLKRGTEILCDIDHEDVIESDDVQSGLIYNPDTGSVFPISEFVLIMLADSDTDPKVEIPLLQEALEYAPESYSIAIQDKMRRLEDMQSSDVGDWNRDEMRYYDKAVATPEQRAAFLNEIRNTPLWGIFLERKKHLMDQVTVRPVRHALEIGCGNSRTVSWTYPPGPHQYAYVGTDIALQRLILAKQAVPEGDFIQCSALNLPLRDDVFDLVIAFGVLHHLPDPTLGLRQGFSKLKPGGQILINEPIEKPRQVRPQSGPLKQLADRIFITYEHSEHDNELELEEAKAMVDKLNGTIQYQAFSGSVLRTILARILPSLGNLGKNQTVWRILIAMDRAFGKVFCRTPNRLGPNSIFLVVGKAEPTEA